MSSKTIRILIADNHPAVSEALAAVFQSETDMEVAGLAGSGQEAVRLAQELNPEVILMDLRMPDLDGVQATQRILAAQPHIRVIGLTGFSEDTEYVRAFTHAGAIRCLTKGGDMEELLSAIRAVTV